MIIKSIDNQLQFLILAISCQYVADSADIFISNLILDISYASSELL